MVKISVDRPRGNAWLIGYIAFVVVGVVAVFLSGVPVRTSLFVTAVCGIVISGFFFFVLPGLGWRTLVDEVFDDGDSIVVRSRGEEERIPFSNINDVIADNNRIGPRIYLKLVSSGKFGSRIAFRPQKEGVARWNLDPFWMDPMVNDLLARAQKAGAGRAAA